MKCPTCGAPRMTRARVEITPATGQGRVVDAWFCRKCGTAVPIGDDRTAKEKA